MPTNQPDIILIQDSREQAGYQSLFQSPCIVQGLELGDYSVVGLEDLIAVERKSLADLLQSITHERTRFERELKQARGLHRFFVVVEAGPATILAGDYQHSKAHPNAVWATVMSWSTKYCPFIFAGTREHGARIIEGLLTQYAARHLKTVRGMERATKKHTHTVEAVVA
ncbi:MAG: ERCC4 domain-containing protein [Thermodesulfobacteriota bacterium]